MIEQPLLGSLLEQIRNSAGPSGKKMSRTDFGALLGITPTQVRNIEQGRSLKAGEYEKLVQKFPQIETGELLVKAVHPTGTAVGQTATTATRWTGMRCIQCQAAYRDDGSITHKSGCPSALPRAAKPYCECTDRNSGWTNQGGQWVCGQCGKLSKMVYEQQYTREVERVASALEVPAAVIAPRAYGDLVALDEELEDPEEQEAPQQVLIPVSEVVTRPTMYFSNSEIQTFKRCRRKWYLAWYRQLKLRAEDPVGALAIGNRVHRALQAWYVPEGETPTDPRIALEAAIRDDWEACKQAYAQKGVDPSPELIKEFNENTALERAMVEGYLQWLTETGVDSGLRVVASETYIEAALDVPGVEVDVKLIGKIDVRVLRDRDGARLFIDHKTAGSLTEPLKTIRMDEQMLHYHVLEWLSDVEASRCDGALYNMLKKVKRTARANPPFFDRVEVRHNTKELEAFKQRLTGVIRMMIETRARLDNGEDPAVVVYPTPSKQCGWDCDFLPVCPMFDDGSRVEDMLQHHYVVDDPYSYYRDQEER